MKSLDGRFKKWTDQNEVQSLESPDCIRKAFDAGYCFRIADEIMDSKPEERCALCGKCEYEHFEVLSGEYKGRMACRSSEPVWGDTFFIKKS